MVAQSSWGGGGHQVEDVADSLERRGDDVELHPVVAGLVVLDGQPEALAHRGDGDPVDLVDGLDRVEGGQRLAGICTWWA